MDSNTLLFYSLTILLFLLVSAFFSAAETALTAVSRARIYQLVKEGNKRAQTVSQLRRNKESLIGAVLLGNNAVNIAASAIATSVSLQLFGEGEGLIGVTLLMTLLVVIFSEILPKTYAIQNAERVSLALCPALVLIVRLLSPITHSIQWFIRKLLAVFGIDINKKQTLISATDAIRGAIELHHREGEVVKQDRDMLGSILDLNDIEVREIMIHRTQVETIDANQSAEAIVQAAVGLMHSRIPLWRNNPDNIIGILHVKNLVQAINHNRRLTSADIVSICRTPWFIPDTTNLRDQLLAFRAKKEHFACVVDEYGSWLGVVTLEDIIEEIVGDIDDEHDETRSGITKLEQDAYLVDGRVSVRDLNRQFDWDLPDEHAATIAGLLTHVAEHLPAVGKHVDIGHFRLTVEAKHATRITRAKIERNTQESVLEDE